MLRFGGRYELLSLVGTGAFGSVYRARDTELDETVAVKVLKPEHIVQPDALERFRRGSAGPPRRPSPTSRAPTTSARTTSQALPDHGVHRRAALSSARPDACRRAGLLPLRLAIDVRGGTAVRRPRALSAPPGLSIAT